MSFTSWKFQGVLFQFGIRKTVFPKCILAPPQAPKYYILVPLDQCWNRDSREGRNPNKASAWTMSLSYLKCLSSLSLPVATSLLLLLYCILCNSHWFFSFFLPCESHVAQILAVKEFPLIAQQCNESRMRAEPLDAFLAWWLWGCCGEGSPCWARSWFYLPRKAPLLSQSERQFQIVKSSWKQERGTLIHPDCAGPSIHNKMMSATWT